MTGRAGAATAMKVATTTASIVVSLAVVLSVGCGGGRSAQPGVSPGPAAESPRPPDGGIAPVPAVDPGAFAAPSPSAPVGASGAPPAAAGASPSPSPTTDPEAARRAEQEQRLTAKVAAAKAKADSLTGQYNGECPELKPGELRHPGAVAHCNHLHEEAAAAIQDYEAARREAQAAGITVQ